LTSPASDGPPWVDSCASAPRHGPSACNRFRLSSSSAFMACTRARP
jgi:hypothetical protein